MFEVNPRTPQLLRRSVLPMMPTSKRFAVVLSDVHIGNGAPTCWYQPAVHERPLMDLLRWIVANRERIREVVLLGDLFDVWTYPPSDKPPSMGDIIRANPRVLGPGGPLADVVKAFPGQVRMLLGNHDISLTQADVDTLNTSLGGNISRGERIQLLTGPSYCVTGASGARTVFSHGHHWTMFNAPDRRSQWGTIPIGHFVSRAIAFQLTRLRQIAVEQPDHGNPTANVVAVWEARHRSKDLADFLLTYFCHSTHMPETARIKMPLGRETTVVEAKRVFKDLFTLWARTLESRPLDALRAARADWTGDDLAWFAQRLALRTASDLVVMGHTHKPVGGVAVSPVNYINTGYLCVARPDLQTRQLTFAQVDLERATARVLALVPGGSGYTVAASRAPVIPSVVLSPFQDFSCYARIENRSDRPLRLVRSSRERASFWVVPPPVQIAPRSRANVWLQDTPGLQGSGGRFTYSDGQRTLEFAVECPVNILFPNVVRSPVAGYVTRTADGPWRTGGVDPRGHPLQVRFFVESLRPGGMVPVSPGPGAPIQVPVRPGGVGSAGHRAGAPTRESRWVVAARAILSRSRTPRERGVVLCASYLSSNDGRPLLDPATEPSGTSPSGVQLKHPPNHLVGRDVQTIALADGSVYRFVWIQPNVPPASPPLTGGIAFLPDPGAPTFTLVTFNVAGLGNDWRRRCTNGHHAEMQLVGFVNAQPISWQVRLGKLELHNYSRRGPTWGYSACNACLHDLASFLTALNSLTRRDKVRASISWERLYDKNKVCGHPTDAANIRRLVDAGWDEPMGPRPVGTSWPTGPPRVPAPPRVDPGVPERPRIFTA
jgi:UDP-2,3-diacylglucosamine pyrophosphatase LpxH